MRPLDFAQIDGNPPLQRRVDPVQIMFQQDVFGRDGCIRLQLEPPMAVGILSGLQGTGRAFDRVFQCLRARESIGGHFV